MNSEDVFIVRVIAFGIAVILTLLEIAVIIALVNGFVSKIGWYFVAVAITIIFVVGVFWAGAMFKKIGKEVENEYIES